MIAWLMASRIGRALSAAGAALMALIVLRGKWQREGARRAAIQAKERDHATAKAIRDRVERNLPERVRELDDRGYRDD